VEGDRKAIADLSRAGTQQRTYHGSITFVKPDRQRQNAEEDEKDQEEE
jgi:hypothetical protein